MKALRELRDEYLRLDPGRLLREKKEASDRARQEQLAAQVAALSCDFVLQVVDEGIANIKERMKPKQKTKYEFNRERKRDFRMNKKSRNTVKKVNYTVDPNDDIAGPPYLNLETDPSPYVRHYQQLVFRETVKRIHYKFANFKTITKLDLAEQLIGDEGIDSLCTAMQGSPVQSINLANNSITTQGVKRLSYTLRSLSQLHSLNLSWNAFDDQAMEFLTHPDRYAPALRVLDLTFNALTIDAAYYIAFLFSSAIDGTVQVLRLGGQTGTIPYWGDGFLQVLIAALMSNEISQLKELHIPDFRITDVGMDLISALLCCDKQELAVLNISKNLIRKKSTRDRLVTAIQVNRQQTALQLQAVDCGFSQASLLRLQERRWDPKQCLSIKWIPASIHTQLALQVLQSVYIARQVYIKFQRVVLNTRKVEKPLTWTPLSLSFENDLLSNINSILLTQQSAEFINRMVRSDLVNLNNEVAFVHKLQEVVATAKSKDISAANNALDHMSTARSNASSSKSMSTARSRRTLMLTDAQRQVEEELQQRVKAAADRLKSRMTNNQSEINQFEQLSRQSLQPWNLSIDRLFELCRVTMIDVRQRMSNRRHRNLYPMTPTELDRIQMSIEDTLSYSIEKATVDQQLIGLYCEQKLLRFCEVQRSLQLMKQQQQQQHRRGGGGGGSQQHLLSHTNSKRDLLAVAEYEEFIYSSIPCCQTLQLPAFFAYYAFLQFAKDVENKQLINVTHLEIAHEEEEEEDDDGESVESGEDGHGGKGAARRRSQQRLSSRVLITERRRTARTTTVDTIGVADKS